MSSATREPILSQPRADYEIAKRNGRFRRQRSGVGAVGRHGDFHFRNETGWLYSIEYARDLDRNDSIAGMTIDRVLDNILQETGIRPDPCTGDENADAFLRDKWKAWAENEDECDLAGEQTWLDIERTVARAALVDGDHFVLPNVSGALELVEAHRCRTPSNTKKNVVHGVELSTTRKRLRYWFTREDLAPHSSLARVRDTVQIDARSELGERLVFHIVDPNRITQTRGVSVYARVADPLGMHDDIEFANLVRQQIASCFALIRNRKETGPLTNPQLGERETETVTGTYSRIIENIAPGMELTNGRGEELTAFSPDVPNPQFFEHVMLVLKIVSANLGLPVHAVLLDPSQTNFSGWRGAHDQARTGYRRLQKWLVNKLHKRVWRWKVANWIAMHPELAAWGNQAGVNLYRVKWNTPSWAYLQPVQDVAADVGKVQGLISTRRRVLADRGFDIDELDGETVTDNARLIRLCIEAAREINAEAEADDERVTWRELLALPIHEGLKVQLGAAPVTGGEQSE